MGEAWSWTNKLEDLRSARRRFNKWRTGKEGPCLANRGRHGEAQHNSIVFCWKRGAGFGISWSEVSCLHVDRKSVV